MENDQIQSNFCNVHSQSDSAGNLRWILITIGGVSMYPMEKKAIEEKKQTMLINNRYGQFLDDAVVDGRNRAISFSLGSDGFVHATVPHFWEEVGTYNISHFSIIYYN